MELISIVVPVYNMEKLLDRCLTSIQNQTYRNLEIVLVDDGSKDNSAEICKKYCNEDSRFKYVFQDNAGVSAARNNGIMQATGDYIGFCDSDDWLESDYIENLFNSIKAGNADVAIGGYKLHDGEHIISTSMPEISEVLSKTQLAERFWEFQDKFLLNSTCNKLYRRSMIKHAFNEEMICGEDMRFNMQNLSEADCFAMVNTDGYCYYQSQNNVIKYPKNNAKQCIEYSDSVRTFLASALPEEAFIKKYEAFLCCNMCRDVCTISAANDFDTSKKMIKEFLDMPELTQVLQHNAFEGTGKKYEIVGNLLKRGMITPIIIASKMLK